MKSKSDNMIQEKREMQSGCPMSKIDTYSNKILTYIRKKLIKKYGDKKPLRTFHAKTIGLVEGQLKPEKNLPDYLREGLFKQVEPYKVWIRFTNGSADITPDKKKAARGMAIKVLDVKSSQHLDEDSEGDTQDIILFTSRMFAPGVGKFQLAGVKLVLGNIPEFISGVVTILINSFKGSLPFLRSARIQIPNVLEEMYYSGTPYSFGANNVIKWHARPLKTITSLMPENPGDNFLRERLIRDLSENAPEEVSFALFVQFHENEHTEPIDDSRIIWKTPFHRVATIMLPKQDLDTPERKQEDINMSFSPGHAIHEHAPLGSVNMVRRKVYKELAEERLRHP